MAQSATDRLRSADRVLIQVTAHGTRIIKELPPWKREQPMEPHEEENKAYQLPTVQRRRKSPNLHTASLTQQTYYQEAQQQTLNQSLLGAPLSAVGGQSINQNAVPGPPSSPLVYSVSPHNVPQHTMPQHAVTQQKIVQHSVAQEPQHNMVQSSMLHNVAAPQHSGALRPLGEEFLIGRLAPGGATSIGERPQPKATDGLTPTSYSQPLNVYIQQADHPQATLESTASLSAMEWQTMTPAPLPAPLMSAPVISPSHMHPEYHQARPHTTTTLDAPQAVYSAPLTATNYHTSSPPQQPAQSPLYPLVAGHQSMMSAAVDQDDTVSLSSLQSIRPKGAVNKSPSRYPPAASLSSFLKSSTLRNTTSQQVPLKDTAALKTADTTNDTPRPTPMAVLLSLEGFKAPSEGSKAHVNQDRSFIQEIAPNLTVFAVFDGHGDHGHEVAQFVSNAFQQQLAIDFPKPSTLHELHTMSKSVNEAQILSWLRKSFTDIDRRLVESSGIDCLYSGCTASVALRFDSTIIVAYVGDSKVAGFQFNGKKPYCLVETPEHSPASKNEYRRIRQLGATVTEQYYQYFSKSISRIVEAGLSVSRSFGDIAARPYGLISEPDFVQFKIPPKTKPRPGRKSYFPLMLVVASDGLWDTISPYEILDFVSNAQQSKDKLLESLKEIAEVAWRRRLAAEGRSDDTTAIIALLQ